jgi:hypothetical protein
MRAVLPAPWIFLLTPSTPHLVVANPELPAHRKTNFRMRSRKLKTLKNKRKNYKEAPPALCVSFLWNYLDGRNQRFAGWTFLGVTFSGPIENSCLAIYHNYLVSPLCDKPMPFRCYGRIPLVKAQYPDSFPSYYVQTSIIYISHNSICFTDNQPLSLLELAAWYHSSRRDLRGKISLRNYAIK